MPNKQKIAVIIPSYKVRAQLGSVISRIDKEIDYIFIVDDCCPEKSWEVAAKLSENDSRIVIIHNAENQGVGGAMIQGYKRALESDASVIVKIDGDGQMKPELISKFVEPILSGKSDYTKGNRFFAFESLKDMPAVRVFGNAALSFISKIMSGYWHSMDPTNGYTAIHQKVLKLIPLDKLEKRYFFENDMLFRLSTLRAVVKDIPMDSVYESEQSNLQISKVLFDFPGKFIQRFFKRIVYNYFLRDFNICSLEILLGIPMLVFGFSFGIFEWISHGIRQEEASAGTVMLAGLPVIVGLNLLLAAINYDVMQTPKESIHLDMD